MCARVAFTTAQTLLPRDGRCDSRIGGVARHTLWLLRRSPSIRQFETIGHPYSVVKTVSASASLPAADKHSRAFRFGLRKKIGIARPLLPGLAQGQRSTLMALGCGTAPLNVKLARYRPKAKGVVLAETKKRLKYP